jgi:hypothetical protein
VKALRTHWKLPLMLAAAGVAGPLWAAPAEPLEWSEPAPDPDPGYVKPSWFRPAVDGEISTRPGTETQDPRSPVEIDEARREARARSDALRQKYEAEARRLEQMIDKSLAAARDAVRRAEESARR